MGTKKGFDKKIKKKVLSKKNRSCDLHKIGANLYSKLPVAPFYAKKYGPGWMGGWMVEYG